MRQSTFAWNRVGPLGNIVFMKMALYNKGDMVLEDVYISVWADPDLGDAGDDYVACDTTLDLGYCYNAGATLSQGRLMHLVWGQYGRTAIAVADGQAYYTLKGVAQAVLTNGTYGWFQFEGPTLNRLFHDGIDDNSEALTTVVGQGLSLSSGLCVTAALAWTDEKDFAVSTEVRATSVSSHAILFGKVTLDTV